MIRRAIFSAAFVVSLYASADVTCGQVLTPPETQTSATLEKVKLQGVVSESRKYSFRVNTSDGKYEIKPTENAVVTLRLNKPYYDFQKRQVKVVKSMASIDSRTAPESQPRAIFDLPEEVYFVSRFEHATLFNRVMGKKIKRINNYLLTAEDPGDIHPSEKQLVMGGELVAGNKPNSATIKIGDKTYEAVFGQKKAFLTGFNIVDLRASETEVFVWGKVDSAGVVWAHRIEFQPIVKMDLAAGQVSNHSSDQ